MSYQNIKNHRKKRKQDIVYIMGDRCCLCGYNKCQSALELHHLNPKNKDFTISQTSKQLETVIDEIKKCILVCANCHREIHAKIIKPPSTSSFMEERVKDVLENKGKLLNHQIFYCKNCGAVCSKKDSFCFKCYNFLRRKAERPTREELKTLIRTKSFVQIGKKYNVSDNAIRKWCVSMNLPSKKTSIKQFSDNEWLQI